MNFKKIFLLVFMFFGISLFAFAEDDIWLTSLEEGLKKAKEEKKLVLVDFTATWCGYCTQLQNEVFEKAEFKEYVKPKFVLVTIDADQNRELVDKHKVDGFPTAVIFDSDGKVKDRIEGAVPLKTFMEFLKKNEPAEMTQILSPNEKNIKEQK